MRVPRFGKFCTSAALVAAGAVMGLSLQAGAAPVAQPVLAAPASVSIPSYCTAHVTTVRQYVMNVDPGDNVFREGAAGHGGKLTCITVYVGDYAKTSEFNPSTGGWVIPPGGIGAWYFNCQMPGFRWTPSGLPYNDCADKYAQTVTTPDGGLKIAWPFYNGSPMVPATTP